MPSFLGFQDWFERPWRGPAGLNVREIKGVELGPEDVALGAEGGVGFVLLFARCGVFDYPGKSEVGVFGSLRQASGEIVESAQEPGIVLAQTIHAQCDEFLGNSSVSEEATASRCERVETKST